MSDVAVLDDLHFTAFMSSKICHDLVGPVGAINNGLELLEEESDEETRAYALELIQYSASVASARLEYARLAFGASSALGSDVDLGHAGNVAKAFVEENKHKLHWSAFPGGIDKTKVRLLLTLTAIAMTSIPAGGDMKVTVSGDAETTKFEIRCTGRGARIPEGFSDMLSGKTGDIDPRSVISYYAARLADTCAMPLTVRKEGPNIVFIAESNQ